MERDNIFPRSLQYLLAVAEHGSFTRAAEVLHVSQPTLSQQIKQLEGTLQSSLLNRSGRSTRLTDAGEVYVRHARRAWGELDAGMRAINEVQDLSRGTLRLGWTPITDYLTCCLLEKYNSKYPGITLSTLEMPQDGIETAVAEGRIDVGIAFSERFSSAEQSNLIEMDMLFEESLCLAVGNKHPSAGQKKMINAQEFGGENLALLNGDFAIRRDIDRYCHEHGIDPHIAIETNSLNVIIEMVQIGKLATIIPCSIVRSQCGLHAIKLNPEIRRKAVTLIYRAGTYKSPALRAFSSLAYEWSVRRLGEAPMRKQNPCPLSASQMQKKTIKKKQGNGIKTDRSTSNAGT